MTKLATAELDGYVRMIARAISFSMAQPKGSRLKPSSQVISQMSPSLYQTLDSFFPPLLRIWRTFPVLRIVSHFRAKSSFSYLNSPIFNLHPHPLFKYSLLGFPLPSHSVHLLTFLMPDQHKSDMNNMAGLTSARTPDIFSVLAHDASRIGVFITLD